MGPINRPWFPSHRINPNNHPGKNKIQAILSKVTGQIIIHAIGKQRIGSK